MVSKESKNKQIKGKLGMVVNTCNPNIFELKQEDPEF